MQEFLPIFLNKSCTIIHPELCFVLLYSILDIGAYIILHPVCISILSLTTASFKLYPPFVQMRTFLCVMELKLDRLRSKTGLPAPLKGTYIYILGQVERRLGLNTSNLCTWVSSLMMEGILSSIRRQPLCLQSSSQVPVLHPSEQELFRWGQQWAAGRGHWRRLGALMNAWKLHCLRLWPAPHAIHRHQIILTIHCVLFRQACVSGLVLGIM